jgi:threonine dehydratase
MGDAEQITVAEIERAATRIAPFVHETPVLRSRSLDAQLGCTLLLKSEQLQRTGAFKARGAHNAVMQLTDAEAARGVATHSSGNHGAALALAARNRGIRATVVMPEKAARVKREAVAAYGAKIVSCAPTLAAREAKLREVQASSGAQVVHPYEDPRVICGQGTVALEIASQCADDPPEVLIVPVGGGGLLAGVAVAMADRLPGCEVIAAEPSGADDAYRSFRERVQLPQLSPDTIADGLRASIGKPNFEIMLRHVRDVVVVSEERIVEAMALLATRTKQLVEASGAVPLAAVMSQPERFAGRRVALVLSGGNVDLDDLPWTRRG